VDVGSHPATVAKFAQSDHDIFHGADADAVEDAVVKFLTK
jgi:esterase/lipase